MVLETLLPKILESTTPLNLILIGLVGYFVVKELNSYYDMKIKLHKYDSDIIVINKDVDDLKKKLEKKIF